MVVQTAGWREERRNSRLQYDPGPQVNAFASSKAKLYSHTLAGGVEVAFEKEVERVAGRMECSKLVE